MTTPTTFRELVGVFGDLINLAVGAIIAVVFVVFIWKIFDAWVINAADEGKRTEGKQTALTAVIVLVIVLMVWGIILLIQNTFF